MNALYRLAHALDIREWHLCEEYSILHSLYKVLPSLSPAHHPTLGGLSGTHPLSVPYHVENLFI